MSPRAQLDELTIRCLWTRVTGLHTLWTARSRCHHRVDDVRLGCAVTSVRLLCSGVGVTSVCVCVCVCVVYYSSECMLCAVHRGAGTGAAG